MPTPQGRGPRRPRNGGNGRSSKNTRRQPGHEPGPLFASKTQHANNPVESTRGRGPVIRMSSQVVTIGRGRVTDWHFTGIERPTNQEGVRALNERIARIIKSARKARIHRIIYSQDSNNDYIAEALRNAGFACRISSTGGHEEGDTIYVFSLNIEN